MKISERWLREWANPPLSREQLTHQLDMAGLAVEACLPASLPLPHIVIGKIETVQALPGTAKLQICQVNVGQESLLSIVCGAANARAGLKVVVALPEASLPNGLKIKKTKIRGVVSEGMLCSQTELGLAEKSEGIWELPEDAPPGELLWDYLQLDDHILEFELTPNRGDCFSVLGIAREVAALNHLPLPVLKNSAEKKVYSDNIFPVEVRAAADCPRYLTRVIHHLRPAATPIWLQEKLRRSGLRAISPIVDVMNYVMLECGQPLHAFDLSTLKEKIVVRRAHDNEELILLDGKTVNLTNDVLVIADAKKAHALAGIMGGAISAVKPETTSIVIESAFFTPDIIAGRARRYGLHTDASHRFERGVDPELPRMAIEHATELLLNIAGGEAGPVHECVALQALPAVTPINLRYSRVQQLLGIIPPAEEITDILRRLNMRARWQDAAWEVVPPGYRFDVREEVDLIEEIARYYGYQHIPATQPLLSWQMVLPKEQEIPLTKIKQHFVEQGFHEVITYSFISKQWQQWCDPQQEALPLANPLSAELAVMRTNLWPGLLQVVQYNLNRQQEYIRCFETGRRFITKNNNLAQEMVVSGIVAGLAVPEQWAYIKRNVDFFDLKSVLSMLFTQTHLVQDFSWVAGQHPALHPAQTAQIYYQKQPIGWCGALHPELQQQIDIKVPVYLFELVLESLTRAELPQYQPVSKFPGIRRDLALLVDQTVNADALQQAVQQCADELLKDLYIFDVYQGKNIPTGQKSVALGLIFQANERTLLEDEIQALVNKIVATLGAKFGATLRV